MSAGIYVKLLGSRTKGEDLIRSVRALQTGETPGVPSFQREPEYFLDLPRAVLAYWMPSELSAALTGLPAFEGADRTARQGLATAYDFRFLRAFWEVPPNSVLDARDDSRWQSDVASFQQACLEATKGRVRWVFFPKGGEYRPFFADVHLVVNWEDHGTEIQGFKNLKTGKVRSRPQNQPYYFLPGFTWPERTTSGYAPQLLPAGAIFGHVGLGAFANRLETIALAVAWQNTRVSEYFVELLLGLGEEGVSGSAARHYTSAIVGSIPFPDDLDPDTAREIARRSVECSQLAAEAIRLDEATVLYRPPFVSGLGVREASERWHRRLLEQKAALLDHSAVIEQTSRASIGLSEEAIREITSTVGPHPGIDLPEESSETAKKVLEEHWHQATDQLISSAVERGLASRSITKKTFVADRWFEVLAQLSGVSAVSLIRTALDLKMTRDEDPASFARHMASFLVGCAFGRWDLRVTALADAEIAAADPFAPQPPFAPATLCEPNGGPNRGEPEAWTSLVRRLGVDWGGPVPRNFGGGYPLDIPVDGTLVSEPLSQRLLAGPDNLTVHVRRVLEEGWGDRAQEIEDELVSLLGVQSLPEYLDRPGGFFADHLATYSKSRRKAPIYWPLSSEGGSYVVWVYYPRLGSDTLFRVVSRHVEPRAAALDQYVATLRAAAGSGRGGAAVEAEIGQLMEWRAELGQLRSTLLELAEHPYRPSPHDGVLVSAAPLWPVFRNSAWRQDTKSAWEKLESGEFDWTYLAREIWPDRVADACERDPGLALAHRRWLEERA